MPAAVRVPSYAVWDAVVFVLNALAFILIGLQLGPIMDRLSRAQHVHYFAFAAAIVLTVILARMGWLMTYNLSLRFANRILGGRAPQTLLFHVPAQSAGVVVRDARDRDARCRACAA